MIQWNLYEFGEHRIGCPVCGRGGRDKTLGLKINVDRTGVAHCFRCAFVEGYRPEQGARLVTPAQPRIKGVPLTAKRATMAAYARDLWAATKPLVGASLAYLEARQCRIPPRDADLRCHDSLRHRSGYEGPALVALVTDAATCEPISLHRTWVRDDGRKANIENPRLLLGGHRKQGGVIRLWPDEAVTSGLGIAEGIETALSLAHGFAPVWALIDAGNLASFSPLPGIEALMIGADNDTAGRAAAMACANRWIDADAQVFITRQAENDLNDSLAEAA
jgi:putative DNA primase/helicase